MANGAFFTGLGEGILQAGGTLGGAFAQRETDEQKRARLAREQLEQRKALLELGQGELALRKGALELGQAERLGALEQRGGEAAAQLLAGATTAADRRFTPEDPAAQIGPGGDVLARGVEQRGAGVREISPEAFETQQRLTREIQAGGPTSGTFRSLLGQVEPTALGTKEGTATLTGLQEAEKFEAEEERKDIQTDIDLTKSSIAVDQNELDHLKFEWQKRQDLFNNKMKEREADPTEKIRGMSSKDANELTDIDVILAEFGDVVNTFDEDFLGLEQNAFAKLAEKTTGLTAKEANFRSSLQRIKNIMGKLRSGVAINPGELARIDSEIGQFNVRPDVFLARIKNNINSIRRQRGIHIDNLGRAKFDVSGFRKTKGGVRVGDRVFTSLKPPTDAEIDGMSDDQVKRLINSGIIGGE